MANPEHLQNLLQGSLAWNEWRQRVPDVLPDLSAAELPGEDFCWANLRGANLSRADLAGSDFSDATLRGANLVGANLQRATLVRTNLVDARLGWANLDEANMFQADLSRSHLVEASLVNANLGRAKLVGANLASADLRYARLVETNLEKSNLVHSSVYGIAAWNLKLEGATHSDLDITRPDEPTVTVDDIELAQFIYLLLNNERVRRVIDSITSKMVLILGRFTPARKALLDAVRSELRKRDYVPVVFDFDKPSTQTTMETVATLAHMSRFVIADLTDARSVLQELRAIVPDRPSLPIQPLLLESQSEPGMLDFFKRYSWFLQVVSYQSAEQLLVDLQRRVIEPAETKWRELALLARPMTV